jgi:two-component system, chemotaxis family, chemotaxis protein CheY
MILIVDDSKAMRMIVKRTLRQAGFDQNPIEEASSAAEALKMLEAGNCKAVLADWNMPEMTGIEMLEQLRKNGNKVTFGFVTSEGTPEMKQRAMDSGAQFFISKPFTVETFQEQLSGVL